MCLILFSWKAHPRYALVVAANRDEFHQRPSATADYWADAPDVLAGRDLQAGGTWMGITRSGRFAAITNYREPDAPEIPLERSRGELVRNFLEGNSAPLPHAETLLADGEYYRGYNLLMGTPGSLAYVSNRDSRALAVSAGSHGLSNHLLDTQWPKVRSGRKRLEQILSEEQVEPEALFDLLTDRALTPGEIPEDLETRLAPEQLMKHYFIVSPVYGTRCSTVLLVGHDRRVTFLERQFGPGGEEQGTQKFEFRYVEGA